MIAKISSPSRLTAALGYNFKKVEKHETSVLLVQGLFHDQNGAYSRAQVLADMLRTIPERCRTKKTVFHCSLNPHPDEKLSDEALSRIAAEYMEALGYGAQPYIVFRHNDIPRAHIHIVSLRVNSEGRKIDDCFERRRSNKVAVCLGFQDFSQLTRDYGEKESRVIQNTVGNVFSGQVVGETARTLSERFGKVLQRRQSVSINRRDVSTSINTQMDSLIPASKISNLTQGMFVGAVSDNFDERIEQKIFHAEIVVDTAKVSAEIKSYRPIPVIADFTNKDGSNNLNETIEANYKSIKQEVLTLVSREVERLKTEPTLCHLIKE